MADRRKGVRKGVARPRRRATDTKRDRPAAAELTIGATEAQNSFGRVLDEALRDRVVVITRHDVPRAVLISVARYETLVAADARRLDDLTAELDALYGDMQTQTVRQGLADAFRASPRKISQAAEAAARRQRRGR